MHAIVPPANVARFDSFEVDLDSGELHHSGVRIPLGEQPTQVLLKLLRAHGALVTRDELRTALWPPNTFVDDADQGLNAAVRRLRDALHDIADQPRFIETIPRRGYRFIGALEGAVSPAPSVLATAAGPSRRLSMTRAAPAIASSIVLAAAWILWPPSPAVITSVRPLVSHLEKVGAPPIGEWSWTTDGARVYFVIRRNTGQSAGACALYQAPITGGDLTELPLPCPYLTTVLGYVKAESALLIQGTTDRPGVEENLETIPLWLVPASVGTPRRIPNVTGYAAAVSNDGRRLASFRGHAGPHESPSNHSRLWTARLDGSELAEVGALPPFAFSGRWAPDGEHVRLAAASRSGNDADNTVWDVSTDGAPPRRLWAGSRGDWTPDGRYYVFERQDAFSQRQDLFAHRESTRGWSMDRSPRQLTVGPLSFAAPGPSGDGRQILAYGWEKRGELMKYDASARTYVSALGGESAIEVEPSPDGQWLLWVRYPEGTLWKSRVDGSERQPLTSKPLEVHLPHWSPDGRQIVFVARSPESPSMALYVAASDGSAREILVRPERETDQFWNPCYLPDGTILFSTLLWRNPSGIRQVDPRTRRVSIVAGAEELRWPVASRQGDVQAVGGELSSLRMFIRRRGSDRWEYLAPNKLGYPQWTRDGRALCGSADPEPVACIDVRTGQFTPFEVQPSFPLVAWAYATWAGLDAEDQPLVTADRSTAAFYALDWDAP